MNRETACFFTGHRVFPEDVRIIKRLAEEIEKKINSGVRDFIAGGALGFDTVCAEEVLKFKEKYPAIRLNLYLPCYDQMRKWSVYDAYRCRLIMSKADNIVYVTESEYTRDCMHKRNRKMAMDAKYCIAYCINPRSGTGKTMEFAEKYGDEIVNLC